MSSDFDWYRRVEIFYYWNIFNGRNRLEKYQNSCCCKILVDFSEERLNEAT